MATNRDRLIQTFLSRNRRKSRSGGINQNLPTGGRNTGFTKGWSDANTVVGRLHSGEPPRRRRRAPVIPGVNAPPSAGKFVPGVGGPYYNPGSGTDNNAPRFRSSTPIQQAPYKPGQAARSRKRRRPTKPNPGPHSPRLN